MSHKEAGTRNNPYPLHLLLIDHEDSFTCNIKSWLEVDPGVHVTILDWKNHTLNCSFCETFDGIFFSPGPGHPADYESSRQLMTALPENLPITGICLGMQMMICEDGGKVSQVKPAHGIASPLISGNHPLFSGIHSAMVGRYHSLAVTDMTPNYRILATVEEGCPMAVESHSRKSCGFQFHPESFLTTCGHTLRTNLLKWLTS